MHCFRRAALRLVSSAALAPARSKPTAALNVPRSIPSPRSTRSLFQKRWNSSETPKQPEANTSAPETAEEKNPEAVKAEEENTRGTVSETHTTEETQEKSSDVAATEEHNARTTVEAAHTTEVASEESLDVKTEETHTTEAAESKNPDVAAAEEDNAQVVNDAVHAMAASSTRPEEATNGGAVKAEQQEESQVAGQEGASVMNAAAENVGKPTSSHGEFSAASSPPDPRQQQIKANRAALLNTEPEPKATVYVGNLFYDMTAEDLRTVMERYGVVEYCIIIFDQRGISKGYGYVQFDSAESASRARAELDAEVIEGRPISIRFARNNINRKLGITRPPSRTLYIGNLSFDMTQEAIHELFKDIPNVIDVRVSVDRRTGNLRGFAHAEFLDMESARIGFEALSTMAPKGRKLRVDYSVETRTTTKFVPGRPTRN